MNRKLLLLSLFLCVSAVAFAQPRPGGWATKQNTVLYEGKYTETGSFYVNETQSQQFINSSSFYAKIYADKMIVTAVPFGEAIARDTEFQYKGDSDGCRIYSLPNGSLFYQVDKNYDLMKVMVSPSMMYGGNVKDYYYYEIVKGEHYMEYNKKHGLDPETLYNKLYGPNPVGFELDY